MSKRPARVDMADLITADDSDTQADLVTEFDRGILESRELLLRDVLCDLPVADQERIVTKIAEARGEIIDHWRKASHHFLQIGRSLIALSALMPQQSLNRFLESYDRVKNEGTGEPALPFSRTTAIRMMQVAKAVDTGWFAKAFIAAGRTFDEDALPPYSIAYKLTTLPEPVLIEAVRQDLVRPDVSRSTIETFHVTMRPNPSSSTGIDAILKDLSRTDRTLLRHYTEITRLLGQREGLVRILEEAGVKAPVVIGRQDTTDAAVALLRRSIQDGGAEAAERSDEGDSGDEAERHAA